MSTWRADSSAVSLGQPDVDSPYTFIPGKQQHFPCPAPPHTKPGLPNNIPNQEVSPYRTPNHINFLPRQTRGDPGHGLCLFFSGGKESRWLPSEGTISEGAIYSEKHSSRTWGLQPQNRYAGKNVFHSETGRERDSEQADVNCGHPGEDAVPGSHTVLHLTVVWTQGGR